MECCVCWEPITKWRSASFSTEGHCRSEHVLCVGCYYKCSACPLCRYQPEVKPPIYAEAYLDTLRERREVHNVINNKIQSLDDIQDYNHLINQMNDIKIVINSLSVIYR